MKSARSSSRVVVWFRLDLRLADNPALYAAAEHGREVLPVFVYAPEEEAPWQPGAASRWWLHQSLGALDAQLRGLGSRLVIRRGPALETLCGLARTSSAEAVFWNRRYEPAIIARDARLEDALQGQGVAVKTFNAALLHEPTAVQNRSGKPFQVFTPFWRHCQANSNPAEPLGAPRHLAGPRNWPKSLAIAELELEPEINWAGGLRATWTPGAEGAASRLNEFLATSFEDYSENRNFPALPGTSHLSPHLHFGEISPRQIWHRLRRLATKKGGAAQQWRQSQFLAEIGWREFAHHLLYYFPHTAVEPLRAEFNNFPWRKNQDWQEAWQKGLTGYPIVDAGMRQLWATGWMHNRVRMLVASFLVKDLLIPWQDGARWFWDTLVDADLANNTLGWQWVAGCGADAAPYFRIFNPTGQGQKFDPNGDYVRSWCPELSGLPDQWLHNPWQAPPEVLARAGVELGHTYPERIVTHTAARDSALAAFARIKSTRAKPSPNLSRKGSGLRSGQ